MFLSGQLVGEALCQRPRQTQPVGYSNRAGFTRPRTPPRNSWYSRPNDFSNLSFQEFAKTYVNIFSSIEILFNFELFYEGTLELVC